MNEKSKPMISVTFFNEQSPSKDLFRADILLARLAQKHLIQSVS